MSPVEFGDLPPTGGSRLGSKVWLAEASELRAHRGAWALLTTRTNRRASGVMAAQIRAGRYLNFSPAGAFQATARGCDVWARYVGDPS